MKFFKPTDNEIKIKNKYKKIADIEIDRVAKEKADEIDVVIRRNDQAINALNERHFKALENICQQVGDELYPIIKEREIEIQRLNKIIAVQKQFYESIRSREFELIETAETANIDFERGFRKFEEGYAAMKNVRRDIAAYNRKQSTIDNKNNKLLGG